MELPHHLHVEASRLRDAAATDNPVTEVQARPLIRSACIWLMRQGCINKEDSPGVISKMGDLLHVIVPLHMCQVPQGRTRATDFASRIFAFFQNQVTRQGADFQLQVPEEEKLTTPLRALQDAGKLKVLGPGELPPQGHSGKSIVGKGRQKLFEEEAGASIPFPTPDHLKPVQAAPRESVPLSQSPPMAGRPSVSSSQEEEKGKRVENQLNAASMLSALAAQAGLDVKVHPSGRGVGVSDLPLPHVNSPVGAPAANTSANTSADTSAGTSAPPKEKPPKEKRNPPKRKQATKRPAAAAAKPAAAKQPKAAAERRSLFEGNAEDEAAAASAPLPASKPTKTKSTPVAFVAPVEFVKSSAGPPNRREDTESEPEVGSEIAFFMSLPPSKGGDDWFVGKVLRVGKQDYWVDVMFVDGKLWCKLDPSERGPLGRWVMLQS